MGAEQAHRAGAVLVSQGAKALLSWGCAAGLDDRISPGCLIIPERIIGASGEIHKVNTEWHQRLYQILERKYPVHTGALVESDAIENRSGKTGWPNGRKPATDWKRSASAARQEHGLPLWRSAPLSTRSQPRFRKRPKGTGCKAYQRLKLLASSYLAPANWMNRTTRHQFSAARRTLKKTAGTGCITVLTYSACF
jgi:hypothetical protein